MVKVPLCERKEGASRGPMGRRPPLAEELGREGSERGIEQGRPPHPRVTMLVEKNASIAPRCPLAEGEGQDNGAIDGQERIDRSNDCASPAGRGRVRLRWAKPYAGEGGLARFRKGRPIGRIDWWAHVRRALLSRARCPGHIARATIFLLQAILANESGGAICGIVLTLRLAGI